jgi:peptidyl-prolyl cis-trans isomerase B (cyclophilin B)
MLRFAKLALFCGLVLSTALVVVMAGPALAATADADVPFVRLSTEEGQVLIALFPDLAPHHVDNFYHLAATGFYDETAFHRIVPGFVIQGGDPNSKDRDPRNDGQGGPSLADVLTEEETEQLAGASSILEAKGYTGLPLDSRANLKAEFSQTAKHLRGSLSMARARDVDSAGSQFFVCVDATPMLDRQYTIFGHVVTGMEAVDAIVSAPTDPAKGREAPAVPVKIDRAEVFRGVENLSAEEQAAFRTMLETIAADGSTW